MGRKNRLAICFVTSSFVGESFGGVQRFVWDFSQWLEKKSFDVVVVSNSLEAIVKSIFFDGYDDSAVEVKSGRFSAKYLPSMLATLILTFTAFLEIVRRNKEFSFSIIHAQDVLGSGIAGVFAHKLLGIPLIVHAHGPSPYFFDATPEATKLQRILAKFLARVVIDNSNLLIATDSYTKSLFLSFISRIEMICIPTPINTDAYFVNKETYAGKKLSENFLLGFIGRLIPQKNLRRLLSAFALAKKSLDKPLKLVIVGDGPERSFLMHEARLLNIDKEIVFSGTVTENKKTELLTSFDVFLMPSLYEGCPIALLEAMATGRAIISSDIPSIRELVKSNKEAILIDPLNVEELRRAILQLYGDLDLRAELGRNAKEKAKLYDINRVYGQISKVYDELIGCKAK